MRRKALPLLVLSIALVLSLGAGVLAQTEKEPILIPDFSLRTADERVVSLSDFRGKIVVLNFWATWCPYCVMELPVLQQIQDELGDEVVVLLIDQIDGQRETVEKGTSYLAEKGITLTNLLDFGTVGYGLFGVPGLPTTVVVDAEGYLASYRAGAVTKALLLKMIEEAR